ncbi:MAG: glycosyltransferase family 4 protein [Candidatus Omnitrophica bacterium]|nr:glycosyltransferase family 4 protein [Candidatus Omnitrophota bacterium]
MKIIINTTPLLSPLTGVGKYTYQIAKALIDLDRKNKYAFYQGYFSDTLFSPRTEQKFLSYVGYVKSFFTYSPMTKRIWHSFKNLGLKFRSDEFDLYFEPNFIPLPIRARKIIVTIHDFSFHLFPEWHPPDRIQYFQKNFWNNIMKADKIIFVSNYIKNEAINLFNFPAEKLTTIYNGVNKEIYRIYEQEELKPITQKYILPPKFIFYLGSIEPRKNIKGLILAYFELGPQFRKEFKLVLGGFRGWKNEEIHSLIKKSNGDIKFLGYIREEELGKIFNLASMFVYPSFYEGFGLPPLEAMSCGCPVVVSNASSLPEVCGEAAYYIDPNDIESISKGILKLATDDVLKKNLTLKGIKQAHKYSWQESAKSLINIFNEI